MGIYYIDEIMGRGKTSAMINFINSSDESTRFLFITPLLDEVDRIQGACASKHFFTPKEAGGKLNNIKTLLREGYNVVSTHALFQRFDVEVMTIVREMGYTLVIDEAIGTIENFKISNYDQDILAESYVDVGQDGVLRWRDEGYDGRFEDYKSKISSGNVHEYNSTHWIALASTALFTSFKDVYIMTYMFEHQVIRCYFDYFKIRYQRLYVGGTSRDTYFLSIDPTEKLDFDYSKLIKIMDKRKLNAIGDDKYALSKAWYKRNYNEPQMVSMRNNLYNFFRNYAKTPSSLNLWTTFCEEEDNKKEKKYDWRGKLSGRGYSKGFVSCTTKGTNKYRKCTTAAYTINLFPDTGIRNFLSKNGIALNNDMYALSEMLQWIWRTAIRDGKEIYLYIPSKRMRNLLIKWIEDVKNGEIYA